MTRRIVAILAVVIMMQPAESLADLFDSMTQRIDSSLNIRRATTEQDNPARGESVLERPRPDYDPLPIKVGSFDLVPAVNFGSTYNSNVFAVPNHATDDLLWNINPSATLVSNWGRHMVAITGLGDLTFYSGNSAQNFQNASLQAEGRYDVATMTWLSGILGYQRVSETHGGLSTPTGPVGPSQYNLYTGSAEAYRGVGMLKTKLNFDTSYYNYNTLDLNNGGSLSQSVRNRTQNDVGGEVEYEVTQNFRPFVHGVYNWRDYTSGGLNSSDGYQLDAGTHMDLGGMTTATVYAGYLSQKYYNLTDGATSAFDFGGDVLWNITGMTSIDGKISRSIEETGDLISPSALATQGSIRVAHELLRNLVLTGKLGYTGYSFQNSTRADDVYNVDAGMRYFFNRYLHGDLSYGFERRNSNVSGDDYGAHTIVVRLGFQY